MVSSCCYLNSFPFHCITIFVLLGSCKVGEGGAHVKAAFLKALTAFFQNL